MSLPDIRYAIRTNPGRGPVKILCPFHQDTTPSLAVYPDGTYCFVCGEHETADEFLKRINTDGATLPERALDTRYRDRTSRKEWVAPVHLSAQVEAWHTILMSDESPRQHRIQWFLDRGIFRSTIKEQMLGHTGDAFVIPVWDNNEVIGVRFRADEGYIDEEDIKRFKYTTQTGQPTLLYRPAKNAGPVIVCEGELDALVLSQWGFDAVTTTSGVGSLHKLITPKEMRLDWVFVATDLDKGGDEGYDRLCRVWNQALPRLRWPAGKDITDALLAVDTLWKEEVIKGWLDAALEGDTWPKLAG